MVEHMSRMGKVLGSMPRMENKITTGQESNPQRSVIHSKEEDARSTSIRTLLEVDTELASARRQCGPETF